MQRDHFHLILSLEESHIINKLVTQDVCSVQEHLISYFSLLELTEHACHTIARPHYDSFLERCYYCLLGNYTVILYVANTIHNEQFAYLIN